MGQDPNRRIESAVAEHGERLFRAARYLLGDEREAEDLCQAVFLELCRSIGRFEGRASLYTWLYRIMLNPMRS
jgi:RNA polymerase sigma-70 factor (ECF subfamily)